MQVFVINSVIVSITYAMADQCGMQAMLDSISQNRKALGRQAVNRNQQIFDYQESLDVLQLDLGLDQVEAQEAVNCIQEWDLGTKVDIKKVELGVEGSNVVDLEKG